MEAFKNSVGKDSRSVSPRRERQRSLKESYEEGTRQSGERAREVLHNRPIRTEVYELADDVGNSHVVSNSVHGQGQRYDQKMSPPHPTVGYDATRLEYVRNGRNAPYVSNSPLAHSSYGPQRATTIPIDVNHQSSDSPERGIPASCSTPEGRIMTHAASLSRPGLADETVYSSYPVQDQSSAPAASFYGPTRDNTLEDIYGHYTSGDLSVCQRQPRGLAARPTTVDEMPDFDATASHGQDAELMIDGGICANSLARNSASPAHRHAIHDLSQSFREEGLPWRSKTTKPGIDLVGYQKSDAGLHKFVFEMPGDVPDPNRHRHGTVPSQQGQQYDKSSFQHPRPYTSTSRPYHSQGEPLRSIPPPHRYENPVQATSDRNNLQKGFFNNPSMSGVLHDAGSRGPRHESWPDTEEQMGHAEVNHAGGFPRPNRTLEKSPPRHSANELEQNPHPDSLPRHPTPVRTGLTQQSPSPPHPSAKPTPARQYPGDSKILVPQANTGDFSIASTVSEKRTSATVSHEELKVLRTRARANPETPKPSCYWRSGWKKLPLC